jgi:hypothetical protein
LELQLHWFTNPQLLHKQNRQPLDLFFVGITLKVIPTLFPQSRIFYILYFYPYCFYIGTIGLTTLEQ